MHSKSAHQRELLLLEHFVEQIAHVAPGAAVGGLNAPAATSWAEVIVA
jgi:hypothetical protein